MTHSPPLAQRIASILVRGALLLAGLVFGLAVLVAGLIAAVGVLLWSLLRGRRPMLPLYWRVFRAAAGRPFGSAGMRRPGGSASRRGEVVDMEVVDVEARELPPASLPRR